MIFSLVFCLGAKVGQFLSVIYPGPGACKNRLVDFLISLADSVPLYLCLRVGGSGASFYARAGTPDRFHAAVSSIELAGRGREKTASIRRVVHHLVATIWNVRLLLSVMEQVVGSCCILVQLSPAAGVPVDCDFRPCSGSVTLYFLIGAVSFSQEALWTSDLMSRRLVVVVIFVPMQGSLYVFFGVLCKSDGGVLCASYWYDGIN